MSRALDKSQVFGKLGNFWNEVIQVDEVNKARALSHAVNSSGLLGQLQAMQDQLGGASDVLVENGYTAFGSADIVSVGVDIQKRVVTELSDGSQVITVITRPKDYDLNLSGLVEIESVEGFLFKTMSCQVLFFPVPDAVATLTVPADEMRERYVLTLPEQDLEILTIQQDGKDLVSGIDFISGPGALVFSENPFALFPSGEIVYRIARKRKRTINAFSMRTDCLSGDPGYVAAYYRENQSLKSFERAIAQAAGLTMVPEDATIVKVFPYCTGATYVTESEVLHVPYYHQLLEVGDRIYKGDNIGGLVTVKSKSTHGDAWWRDVEWPNDSLDMSVMSRFGLEVPHAYIKVASNAPNDPLPLHLYYNETKEGDRDKFWEFLERQVNWSDNNLLADLLGLSEFTVPIQENMFQIIADNFINNKVLVVELKTAMAGAKYDDAARAFIDREKPTGMLTLIHEKDDYVIPPDAMVVEGAGTAVANVVYLRDGDQSGFPKYVNSGVRIINIVGDWFVVQTSPTSELFYSESANLDTYNTPDLVPSWDTEADGTPDAPTVSRATWADIDAAGIPRHTVPLLTE